MVTVTHEPLIVCAGGGTGGHLYPQLSMVRELARRRPDARLLFLTTERPIDARTIGRMMEGCGPAYDIVAQPVLPLPARVTGIWSFARAWRASMRLCREKFARRRPDVVIGSGGFGSAPAICVARELAVPTALLNPDAVPGKANRYLAPKADVVFAQWEATRAHFVGNVRVRPVGCPVREAFRTTHDRAAAARRFALDPQCSTLVVTGASQGAISINQTMVAIADLLARRKNWQILHLTGSTDVGLVRMSYRSRGIAASVLEYTEFMAEALALADLVVSRAGASTLAELTAMGRASVLMPYPHHRDRHQFFNARVLADAEAAVIVEDQGAAMENAPPLAEALGRLMHDDAARTRTADRAARLGRPEAAATIADELLALMGDGGRRASSRRSLRSGFAPHSEPQALAPGRRRD